MCGRGTLAPVRAAHCRALPRTEHTRECTCTCEMQIAHAPAAHEYTSVCAPAPAPAPVSALCPACDRARMRASMRAC
eukprot:7967861-Alexandrium_andersonii.AAC.1